MDSDAHGNNDDFTVPVSGGGRHHLSEHVYCVAVAFQNDSE